VSRVSGAREDPASLTVLLTPQADRFFLVPQQRELDAGELDVVTLSGEEHRVDADKLAEFEVSRADAEAHVRAQAEQVIAGAVDAVGRTLGLTDAGAGVGQPERPPDRVDRTGDHLLGLRSDVCLGVGSAHLELRELVRIDAMLLAAERDDVQLAGVELTLLRNEEEAVGLRREEDRQRCGIFTRAAHATHPALSGGGSSGVRMCASKRSR